MSRESNFDAIKCMDIKILQLSWCVHDIIWNFLLHFHFYLFGYKFVELMIFYFLQEKMCAPKKLGVSQMFCAPERARLESGAQFFQVFMYNGVVIYSDIGFML